MATPKMKWQHWSNAFATHQPVLHEVARRCDGPIVEFGCGEGSTRMLHAICAERGIDLLTLDSDADWLGRYSGALAGSRHEFRLVDDWAVTTGDLAARRWGLVFVDQGSWEARADTARRLVDSAEYIIVHDCDALPAMGLLGREIRPIVGPHDVGLRDYGDVFSSWREFFPDAPWPYATTGPPTLLGSNRHDVSSVAVDYGRHAPPRLWQRAERVARTVGTQVVSRARSARGGTDRG